MVQSLLLASRMENIMWSLLQITFFFFCQYALNDWESAGYYAVTFSWGSDPFKTAWESSTFSLVNALTDAVLCTQFQMVCRLDSRVHLQIQVKKSWLRSKSHSKDRRSLKIPGRDPISLQKSKPQILLWPTKGQFSQANGGLITELRKLTAP